jgi:arylsulfatase A-like enzyme
MRKIAILYFLILSFAAVFFISCSQTPKQNNVIFFMVDDLGWKDLGCYDSEFYETPHIDDFAKQGVRFTDAYAACHVCSPTRASFITGKYPASINLTDWLPGRKDFPFQKLKNVEINQHIPYELTTLPEVLKENGYETAIIGKWHLGEDSASIQRQGFDWHTPDWNKGWPNNGYYPPYGLKGLVAGSEQEYLTDRLTDEALTYIEDNKDKPFFLYLSHFAVHDPIQGRRDLVDKYNNKLDTLPQSAGKDFILEGNPDQVDSITKKFMDDSQDEDLHKGYRVFDDKTVKIKQKQDNTEFAAMVESVDESLKRVLDKINELDLEDNTIIIFYSDNGGMAAANFYYPDRSIKTKDLDKAFSTSNLPLRGAKGWLYEGGIRVPMIVKWPHNATIDTICSEPVITPDFFPTILEMLGIKNDIAGLDGESFVPSLKGQETIPDRPIFWHFPHYSNHGMQSPGGAVRLGDYKLLEYYENGSVQLFNLKNDIEEQNNLSDSMPEKVIELRAFLKSWRDKVGAKMMEPNPDYLSE